MSTPIPVSKVVDGKSYEGTYVAEGRPAFIVVTSAFGNKSGSPGSLEHQFYAEGILGEIVREALRGKRGSAV